MTKKLTLHIMPADLSKENYNKVNNIALKAHKLLNCRGSQGQTLDFIKINFIY